MNLEVSVLCSVFILQFQKHFVTSTVPLAARKDALIQGKEGKKIIVW